MKYLQIYLSYIYIMGPVTGSLPAMPQWVGTGLESVRCWECCTGSCLVLALCGILTVYYHVLRLILFMSLPWITLIEIWVKNDRNMYEVFINMFAFLYLGASNWLSPCSTSMSRYRSGPGPMLIGSCPVLALCGISTFYYHVLRPILFMSLPWITFSEIWV